MTGGALPFSSHMAPLSPRPPPSSLPPQCKSCVADSGRRGNRCISCTAEENKRIHKNGTCQVRMLLHAEPEHAWRAYEPQDERSLLPGPAPSGALQSPPPPHPLLQCAKGFEWGVDAAKDTCVPKVEDPQDPPEA